MSKYGAPFGLAGIRVLMGLENDAHYGFNSGILDAGGGKWVIPYRRALNHTLVNGAEFRVAETYDQGRTLVNDRLIYTNSACDTRCSVSGVMANGRLGILATRRNAAEAYLAPVFMYSDDGGETWETRVLPVPAAGWGINFHGLLIDFPASVGGSDNGGFIAYSYGHAGGHVDAIYTTDNGETWAWRTQAAVKPSGVPSLTEAACARIGTQDKWIMLVRPSGEVDAPAIAFTSADPLNMGTGISAGVGIAANPPQVIYDEATNRFWYTSFHRRDRGWKRNPTKGLENVFLVACADADQLYAAGGSMAALGLDWEIACYLPDWASGYLHPYLIDGKWWATFVCGEQYPDHGYSKLCMIGDFPMSGLDTCNLAHMMQWQGNAESITVRREVEVGFVLTPPVYRGFLTLATDSATPGIAIQTFTTSARYMIRFGNPAGLGGGVMLSGGTATYVT